MEDIKAGAQPTVVGFALMVELKKADGAGEIKLYDTTDSALRDLIGGRVDIAILDRPLMQLAIQRNPDWNVQQVPLERQSDKYPIMSQVYDVIFGIAPDEQELYQAFNGQIAKIWADPGGAQRQSGARRWS